jgi:hypothetical protein
MWKQVLVRELAAVLLLKLAALFIIWHAFFAQPEKQEVTDQMVGQLLLGDSPQSATPPTIQIAIQE